MADPILTDQEYNALATGVQTSAEAWQNYGNWMQDSAIAEAYNDPEYFMREADTMYAQQARGFNEQTQAANQQVRMGRAMRGLSGGAFKKGRARNEAANVSRLSGLRTELDAAAEQKRIGVEREWMGMLAKKDELKMEAVAQHQAFARRLGEQAAYDKQYKKDWYYYDTKSDATRALYAEISPGMLDEIDTWKARKEAWDPSYGNWGKYIDTGTTEAERRAAYQRSRPTGTGGYMPSGGF